MWTFRTAAQSGSVVGRALVLVEPESREATMVVTGWFNAARCSFGAVVLDSHAFEEEDDERVPGRRSWDAFMVKARAPRCFAFPICQHVIFEVDWRELCIDYKYVSLVNQNA